MKARISFRVSTVLWLHEARRRELQSFLGDFRDTVTELAFFTGFTHPPLPLATLRERAAVLTAIMPEFRALGFRVGINHLSTLGHLDENLENSLREPWQHLVDLDGAVSPSCYCASDLEFREYLRQVYQALAAAGPEFIWVDDDVRLESHPRAVTMACFCDRCLATFARETGHAWTREALREAFQAGAPTMQFALRQAWLAHNRSYLANLLALVRRAADEVNPALPLGLMTGETSYSGYGFTADAEAMAGPAHVEVKWRPGGGFYEDGYPTGLLHKAHSVGRQIAFLPAAVHDVQYEHENFPYQVLKKSRIAFVTEIAAALGAGCTGAALNCMGVVADPIEEYRPYFAAVARARGFCHAAVTAFTRSANTGVWLAFNQDHTAAQGLGESWTRTGLWGGGLHFANELYELGLPPAYERRGAAVTLLPGGNVREFSRDALLELLRGGVLLDGPALEVLHELGLGGYLGWEVREHKEKDTLERFTADPINGAYAGWQRDCRPSFWAETTYLLRPLTPASRPLAEVFDFTPSEFGPCSGVFENELGGRVAVLGYYPWRSLQSLAKCEQMRALVRWLSRDRLPAYVPSFHKTALWCRRDPDGNPALMLINASLDPAAGLRLALRGDYQRLRCTPLAGRARTVPCHARDGVYAVFELPELGPWQPLLCTVPR